LSHELLYTSAQQGLKPGSYGFCTVMATEGLSKVLQDRLESLSGYEHAFALTDRRSQLNPVNYSHLIVTVANQRLHLLSRIADAGTDYSGRSNKLAHHVALQPNELTAASPASTLASPGFCKTSFDGHARSLPHGVLPPAIPRSPAVCVSWENVTGDAGWAGVLAEQTLQNASRSITLIYSPGCDVLPLVVEAISLLPPDRQWRTTFSTYFTKLPAGVDCQWRFVLDGTPSADQARRNLQSPPIDLTKRTTPPSEGPLVEAARTGRLPDASPDAALDSDASSSSQTAARTVSPGRTAGRSSSADGGSDSHGIGGTSVRRKSSGGPPLEDLFARRGPSQVMLASILGGSVLALVLLVGLGIFVTGGFDGPPPDPSLETRPTEQTVEIEKPKALVELNKPKKETQSIDNTQQPVASAGDKNEVANSKVTKPEETPSGPDQIFKDIKAKGGVLSLPKREQGLTSPFGEHELCKVFVRKASDCDLKLITTETMDDGQPRLFLVANRDSTDDRKSWTAVSRAKNTTIQLVEETPIGQFTLKDQSLSFEWKQAPDWTSPFGLLYCKLDFHVGTDIIQCSLTKPTILPLDHLDLAHRKSSLAAGIPVGTLSSVRFLRYDIELRLGNWSQVKSGINAGDHQLLKFEIPAEGDVGNTRIDLEVSFIPPDAQRDASFACRAFVFPSFLRPQQDPNAPPGWEIVTQRNDLIDDATKEGFILPDLERYKKKRADDRKKAVTEVANAKKQIPAIESLIKLKDLEISNATKAGQDRLVGELNEDRTTLQNSLNKLKAVVRYWQQLVDHCDETLKWMDAIRDRFAKIQSKLEFRYAIYLEFLSDSTVEQVVLAETNPAPSNRKPKGAKVDAVNVEK
jgi:GTPase-associated protein 1, N-terminal domain type 2/GTPase-associated protein 1, middle domain